MSQQYFRYAGIVLVALVVAVIISVMSPRALRGNLTDDRVLHAMDTDGDGATSLKEIRRGIIAAIRAMATNDLAWDVDDNHVTNRSDLRIVIASIRSFLGASCGNGTEEAGEQCDTGAQNDVPCVAAAGGFCTYCSRTCRNVTVQSAPLLHCGDGLVDEGEACDDGALNGAVSGMCNGGCTSLDPEIATIDDDIETYISSTPVHLLSVVDRTDFMPRHFADLHLKGVSENPAFEIEADASYHAGVWETKNIVLTALSEGFSATPSFVLADDDQGGPGGGMQRRYFAVRNNGTSEYRMRWRITGQGTTHVRPVLVSKIPSLNYVGNKRILIMKGRITTTIPSEPTFDAHLTSNLEALKTAYRNNSNGKANLFFDVRETYDQPTFDPSTARCYERPTLVELMSGFLGSIGLVPLNYLRYHYEASLFTMHDDSKSLFASCIQTHGGIGLVGCQHCPRYAMVNPESGKENANLLHEFGHEMNIGHPTLNNYCGPNDTTVITEIEIFGFCSQQLQRATPPIPILNSNLPVRNDIMALNGDTGASYGILMRAQLGWLMGAQVKLITEPGLYSVYSDHNDRTSDPSKPLILQILVKRNGVPDYVYITVPNIRRAVPFPTMSDLERDYGTYYSDGIQLHGYAGATDIVYGPLNDTDTQDAAYKTPLLPHQKVTLQWPGTNISIELLERNGEEARVQIGTGS